MNKRSSSSLFLMEQIVVILIFAICAAVCVKIFVDAYLTTNQAKDISNALLVAESGAECYKAVGGDATQLAEALGGETQANGAIAVYYNNEWQVCGQAEAAYVLRLTALPLHTEPYAPVSADLAVEKSTGEELVAFTVTAGGGLHE